MSTDRATTRAVRLWLEEGVTALPDRVLDAVLDQLPATRQRQSAWWRVRGLFRTHKAVAFSGVAVMLLLVVAQGIGLLAQPGPRRGAGAGVPAATPNELPASGTMLEAGTTYVVGAPLPVRVTFIAPAGWAVCGIGAAEVSLCPERDERAVTFLIAENVVADPCDPSRPLLEPPVGPSVDDLVVAISRLANFAATDPVEVTGDGFTGKQFRLTAPAAPPCGLTAVGLGTWSSRERINGVSRGEVNLVRIMDIGGVRLMVAGAHYSGASAESIAEIDDLIGSIRVAPR